MNEQQVRQWNKMFFTLVSQMREKQREYFRTRSSRAKDESIALEKRVDTIIADIQLKMDGQQTMNFDNEQ